MVTTNAPWDPFVATAPDATMPWGKHKGSLLKDVPKDYLQWVAYKATMTSPELRAACEQLLGVQPATMFPETNEFPVLTMTVLKSEWAEMGRQAIEDKARIAKLEAEVKALKREARGRDALSASDAIRAVVRRWYGKVSRTFHPDAGGTTAQQVTVNVCYRELMSMLEET